MRGSIKSALREEGAAFRLVSDALSLQREERGQHSVSDLIARPQNTEFIFIDFISIVILEVALNYLKRGLRKGTVTVTFSPEICSGRTSRRQE